MHIRGCVSTDAGTTRALCKDAAVLKVAASMRYGRIAFAVLCNGINDASHAGRTSALVAERFAAWFQEELPAILADAEEILGEENKGRVLTEVLQSDHGRHSFTKRMFDAAEPAIRQRLAAIAGEVQVRLAGYKRLYRTDAATRTSCLLLMGGEYLLMRIGSANALYAKGGEWRMLTGEESNAGPEDAAPAVPVFVRGYTERRTGFLLCSDGFWRLQDKERLRKMLKKTIGASERRMQHALKVMTRFVRRRGERDDAFAVMLSVN